MKLSEDAIRAKVRELFQMKNLARMDAWMISGTFAGVLEMETVERVMNEEIVKMPIDVQHYWQGECNCQGTHHISLN